jgi:hypothetical protein
MSLISYPKRFLVALDLKKRGCLESALVQAVRAKQCLGSKCCISINILRVALKLGQTMAFYGLDRLFKAFLGSP